MPDGSRLPTKYPIHAIALLTPSGTPRQYEALKAAIKRERRILQPVDIWNGQLIDGRMRMAVAAEIGIELPTNDISGRQERDLISHIIDRNLARAHYKPGQRALAAVDIASRGSDED